jgi:hypothetical protein
MDTKIWKLICRAIRSADRSVSRVGRRPKYTDQQIIKMYLWSVAHDRPLCWACERSHYGTMYRPKQLPSVSQFCRRVKTQRIQQMLVAVSNYFVRCQIPAGVAFLDGKPLVVSEYSKDPDAKIGYADGRMRRGYKLHGFITQDGWIAGFQTHSLNVGEPNTARSLLDMTTPGTLVLADGNYDSGPLYQAIADRRSVLLTRLRSSKRSEKQLKQVCPSRLAAITLWQDCAEVCEQIMKTRDEVERIFGALTSFGGGLAPLPAWVRRLTRVRRWVTAKIIIYHARLFCRKVA